MIHKIIFLLASIFVFFAGTFIYGVAVNSYNNEIAEFLNETKDFDRSKVTLEIKKKNYRLTVYYNDKPLKSYKAVFGRSSTIAGILGNNKTVPNGTYKISKIDTSSVYKKFFKLNYPGIKDLADLFENNHITKEEYEYLVSNENPEKVLEQKFSEINIGLQGTGNMDFILNNFPVVFNWTNGSIAVSNKAIDEIYLLIEEGTKIVVKN